MFNIFRKKHGLPSKARLEACTLCQLDCRGCYMRKWNYCGVGAGYLSFENFAKFLKMNPFVKDIELSGNGEIFLNPDLLRIIEHAYRRGTKLCAFNGANFNDVSEDMLEALVKYGFAGLTISIDGSSQESYSRYRRGGDFEKVISNIKKLNRFKRKYGSKTPELEWQYVILPSNDSREEIRRAKKMAAALGASICFKRDWGGHAPADPAMAKEETGLGYDAADGRLSTFEKHRREMCLDLWSSPQINWDGRLFGCCVNTTLDLGVNVFEAGLEKALSSRRVREIKKMLMGEGIAEGSFCQKCNEYKTMVQSGQFIRREDVRDFS